MSSNATSKPSYWEVAIGLVMLGLIVLILYLTLSQTYQQGVAPPDPPHPAPCFTPHLTTDEQLDSWLGVPTRVDVIDGGSDYFTVRQYGNHVAERTITLRRDRIVVGYSANMRQYICDLPVTHTPED